MNQFKEPLRQTVARLIQQFRAMKMTPPESFDDMVRVSRNSGEVPNEFFEQSILALTCRMVDMMEQVTQVHQHVYEAFVAEIENLKTRIKKLEGE